MLENRLLHNALGNNDGISPEDFGIGTQLGLYRRNHCNS